MSEEPLSIADYPLAEKRPEIVRGKRGKGLDEITLEAVLADRVTLEDLRITRERRCASRPRSPAPPGGRRSPRISSARAELVDVPQDFIMRIYELLRPGRAQSQEELLAAARELRDQHTSRAHGGVRRGGRRGLRAARPVHQAVLSTRRMTWKTAYRSIYYDGAPEPADPDLAKERRRSSSSTCRTPISTRPDRASLSADEQRRYDAWTPFHERMRDIVIPRTRGAPEALSRERVSNASSRASPAIPRTAATDRCRRRCRAGTICFCPRTSCRLNSSRSSQPQGDEIVVTKTTDSALTGTNLRLILTNLGIKTVVCCGIFTDQCVSSTVRSLADESFGVVVVEDCCAAGIGRAASQGARNHQHDLLPRHVERGTQGDHGLRAKIVKRVNFLFGRSTPQRRRGARLAAG